MQTSNKPSSVQAPEPLLQCITSWLCNESVEMVLEVVFEAAWHADTATAMIVSKLLTACYLCNCRQQNHERLPQYGAEPRAAPINCSPRHVDQIELCVRFCAAFVGSAKHAYAYTEHGGMGAVHEILADFTIRNMSNAAQQ